MSDLLEEQKKTNKNLELVNETLTNYGEKIGDIEKDTTAIKDHVKVIRETQEEHDKRIKKLEHDKLKSGKD